MSGCPEDGEVCHFGTPREVRAQWLGKIDQKLAAKSLPEKSQNDGAAFRGSN